MITVGPTAAVAAGILLAAWLAFAVWATLRAMRLRSRSNRAAEDLRNASLLLEEAPTVYMIVDAKDRVEAGPGLADWFGFHAAPTRFADFKDVLGDARFEEFADAVHSARKTARSLGMELRLMGSQRILFAQGGPAPESFGGNEAAMIWFFDASESRSEIASLMSEARRAGEAVDALSALIEAAPFPMWYRGPDLRLSLVNQAYVRAVEAENAAEVIARGLELVEMSGSDSAQAVAGRVYEEGRAHVRTVPATLHGERRMVRIADVPLGEAGVAGYAVDIEELEQAQSELKRFVRAQRDMLDLLSAGVVQFDADRALTFYNQPFQRIFAMEGEWLADRPEFDRVLDRMRDAERLPESRDFPAWKAERRGWFQAGDEPVEENWLLSDGTHLRVVAQPMPDGGLLIIFEDRTEQAQLAQARDTLLRVRTATFDNLAEAIGVFAADGRLLLWNTRFRELWGLDEETLAGHPRVDALAETVAPLLEQGSDASSMDQAVRSATLDRKADSGRFALKDGRRFAFGAVPLPDGNALFTLLDISDSTRIEEALRERNEALEAADQVKTAFVSNMSYELRTPLTSIAGFAEMLANGYAGELSEQGEEYVLAILDSVAKLRFQIDDILDLTQSEAGGLAISREEVDLKTLCEDAAGDARGRAEASEHEFESAIDWSVGSVTGDARRLRHSLDHLLRNALRYTPRGGHVSLIAEGDEREARISVADNGVGIATDEQLKVFDRFHRADAEEHSRALGLGLPLTKQFVEAHGGTIALASEKGKGTRVMITLPRSDRG